MKKFAFLLLSSVLACIFTNCEKTAPPPLMYILNIDPRNEAGESLCEKLLDDTISIEKYKSYDISPQLYKHRQVGDDLFKLSPLKISVESDGYPIIDLQFAKFGSVLPQIEYYLTCPTIFGDEEEHAIISYWRFEKRPEYTAACYKVTVDGQEIPVLDRGGRGFRITLTSYNQ